MDKKSLTKEQVITTIPNIISRAIKSGLTTKENWFTHTMDIELAVEKFNIDLDRWLKADDFNFCHDFYGIFVNINRITKEFENHFVPRFAK